MNVWTRKSADDPYCANCSLTWDMHIAGSNACPSTEYQIRQLESLRSRLGSCEKEAEAQIARRDKIIEELAKRAGEAERRLDQIRELIRRAPNGNPYVDRVWELVR